MLNRLCSGVIFCEINHYFVVTVSPFHMPTPWVVPRFNKLPGRKKNTLKSLTHFCESLAHDRHHRRSIRKGVLWKEKRIRSFEQYSEWEGVGEFLSKWDPLPALFCVLWRICTSDWMTEWYTQWCWNLSTRVFILNKDILPLELSATVLQKTSRVSQGKFLEDTARLISFWDLVEIWFMTKF